MRIIKFALPLAALFFFGTVGTYADTPKAKRSASTQKSSSAKKKSSSGKSAKASKSARSKKSGKKAAKETAKKQPTVTKAALNWIDDLPEVELPTEAGPPDTVLYQPAPEPDLDSESDLESEPDGQDEP